MSFLNRLLIFLQDECNYDPAMRGVEQQEMTTLIGRIKIDALATRASAIRQGMSCSVIPPRYDKSIRSSVMGGMNYHVEIHFDDGVVWLARIRRSNVTSPPLELQNYIVQSEVATLRFLQRTSVPAPRVFDFQFDHEDNPVGVGYILMEKMPGKSLRWSRATQEQRKNVMSQLVDIFIELRRHPFDQIGSLILPGHAHVGPLARESLTDFTDSGMQALGPFSSLRDYHTASLQLILHQILRDELYALKRVDGYLIHRFLLDLIPSVFPQTERGQESFYLKHADDKGDHILVDEDYNITAIIDWEWAYTTSQSLAFSSPIAFLPVRSFYEGSNDLGGDETVFAHLFEEAERHDLAQLVRNGRLQHRFMFCCGYDLEDWEGFLGLFHGLRKVVGVDESLDWDEWKTVALERYRADDGLRQLLQ